MSAVDVALAEPPAADPDDTSTAHVERAAGALAGLRRAGELYGRWREHPAAARPLSEEPWGGAEDRRLVDDLRGVDFGMLDAVAARAAALSRAAESLGPGLVSAGAELLEHPGGAAGEGASLRMSEVVTAMRVWQDGAEQFATAVDGVRGAIDAVLRRWADEARSADPRSDDLDRGRADLDLIDRAVADGLPPAALRSPGTPLGDLGASSVEVLARLDDFAARHHAELVKTRRGVRAARDAVERLWQVFGQLLADLPADPFAALSPGARSDEPVVVIRDGERTVLLSGPDENGAYSVVLDGSPHHLDFSDGPVRFTEGGTAVTATLVEEGKVAIAVDDGSGPPTTYTVDAEPDPAPPPAEPAPDGAPSTPSGESGGAGSGGAGSGGGGAVAGGPGAPSASAPSAPVADGPSSGAEAAGGDQRKAAMPAGAPAAGGGSGGGMPMGGGMGMGMGAGAGGQGGDGERKASSWKLAGNLFDDNDPASGFDGVIGGSVQK